MAKVRGPLFSLDARGQFGDALLFRGGTRRTHVYQPADRSRINQQPASAKQAPVRARFGEAVAAWRALTAPERAAWDAQALGSSRNVNGWNLFLKAWAATANASQPQPLRFLPGPAAYLPDLGIDQGQQPLTRTFDFRAFLGA